MGQTVLVEAPTRRCPLVLAMTCRRESNLGCAEAQLRVTARLLLSGQFRQDEPDAPVPPAVPPPRCREPQGRAAPDTWAQLCHCTLASVGGGRSPWLPHQCPRSWVLGAPALWKSWQCSRATQPCLLWGSGKTVYPFPLNTPLLICHQTVGSRVRVTCAARERSSFQHSGEQLLGECDPLKRCYLRAPVSLKAETPQPGLGIKGPWASRTLL